MTLAKWLGDMRIEFRVQDGAVIGYLRYREQGITPKHGYEYTPMSFLAAVLKDYGNRGVCYPSWLSDQKIEELRELIHAR